MDRMAFHSTGAALAAAAFMLVAAPAAAAVDHAAHPSWDAGPVPDAVLNRMRGGFALGNGTEISIGLEFTTTINGETVVQSLTEDDLLGGQGVVHRITTSAEQPGDGLPGLGETEVFETSLQGHRVSVELTDRVRGLMNIIQTDIDQTNIQRDVVMNLGVSASPASLRAGSLTMRMQSAAGLGL